jgi:hypothetical protein
MKIKKLILILFLLISNTTYASNFISDKDNKVVGVKTDTIRLDKRLLYRAEYNHMKERTQTSAAYEINKNNYIIIYLIHSKENNMFEEFDDTIKIRYKYKF